MQALKALVIFMGVLIAVGVTVIGVTIYRRATDMVSDDKAAPSASAPWMSGQTGSVVPPPASSGDTASRPGLATQGATGGALTLSNAAPASFGTRDLGLPPGSEIVSVQTLSLQPGQEQIVVHARLPDGGASILVLDPRRGNIAGEWRTRGALDSGGAQPP